MIIDANILLYARDSSNPFHAAAESWLTDRLNGPVRVGLPWQSLVAFVRIATHPRAFARPLDPAAAWAQVDAWMNAPAAWVPTPGVTHGAVLGRLLVDHGARGNLVSDAHLAALAIEHGVAVCSADSDFVRFPEVRWVNPLRGS